MDIYNIAIIYVILYKMSMFLFGVFLYSCISYIDRVHAREKTRHIGCFIHKILSECKYSIVCTIYDKSRYIILRPLCVFAECITGFIEGIENCEPICKINYTQINDEIIEEDIKKDTLVEQDGIKHNKPIEQDIIEHNKPIEKDIIEQDIIKHDIIKHDTSSQCEHLDTETPQIIDSGKKQTSITLVRRRYNNT